MADQFFMPTLRDGLSQGDIVRDCPVGAVPAPIHIVRLFKNDPPPEPRGKIWIHPPGSKPYKQPPAPAAFKKLNDEPDGILFEANLRMGIVLSEDCVVLEKINNRRLAGHDLTNKVSEVPFHVAPIEPWPPDTDTVQVDDTVVTKASLIEQGQFHSLWAIPEVKDREGQIVVPRGYVDLRYSTPLRPAFAELLPRVASLTDSARFVLQAKLYTFHTGLEVPSGLKCPSCSASHSLTDILAAQDVNEKKAADLGLSSGPGKIESA